jgi:hypothetical protein
MKFLLLFLFFFKSSLPRFFYYLRASSFGSFLVLTSLFFGALALDNLWPPLIFAEDSQNVLQSHPEPPNTLNLSADTPPLGAPENLMPENSVPGSVAPEKTAPENLGQDKSLPDLSLEIDSPLRIVLPLNALPQSQILAEISKTLLSPPPDTPPDNYVELLEKAIVLYFQTALNNPSDPSNYRALGRLSEQMALWSEDPFERREFLDEAQVRFARAALIDLENSFQSQPPAPSSPPVPEDTLNPYLAELAWSGRLRRGEVTLEELIRHHEDTFIPAHYRPKFWEDRFFLIQVTDPEEKEIIFTTAAEDFLTLWLAMPMEVPLKEDPNRLGPQKIKKISVLEAWANTLLSLAGAETDLAQKQIYFNHTLATFELALDLPLDEFEMGILYAYLNRAELLTYNRDSQLALWALKDTFFPKYLQTANQSPALNAIWGEDLLSRAERQLDPRSWNFYLEEAKKRYALYLKETPEPHKGYARQAEALEWRTRNIRNFLLNRDPDESITRERTILTLALESYQQAYALHPESLPYLRALSRVSLKLASLAPDADTFLDLFEMALGYFLSATARDPDTSLAFFTWGKDLMNLPRPNFKFQQELKLAQERLITETLVAFRQYLRANNPDLQILVEMADLTYQAARELPSHQIQALGLLVEITQRLVTFAPQDPNYRFALGFAMFAKIATNSDIPLDDPQAKRIFFTILQNFGEGLEILSLAPQIGENYYGEPPPPPNPLNALRIPNNTPKFLEFETFARVAEKGASYQERLTGVLNLHLARFFDLLAPLTLPPWYKLQLAGFLRRTAATGYLPAPESVSYFRLGLSLLEKEIFSLQNPEITDPELLARLYAEKGLILAELSLVLKADKEPLLAKAKLAWEEADKIVPGSSAYARARLAAWEGDQDTLKSLIAHEAREEDLFYWPPYALAIQEPCFQNYQNQTWFKNLWFGYKH